MRRGLIEEVEYKRKQIKSIGQEMHLILVRYKKDKDIVTVVGAGREIPGAFTDLVETTTILKDLDMTERQLSVYINNSKK